MDERACPSVDEIRDFLNERLDAARDEQLSLHIQECPRCSEVMTTVADSDETQSGNDLLPVLAEIRTLPKDAGFESEDACLEAVERARQIPEQSSQADSSLEIADAGTPAPSRLGPYELEAEIGTGGMGSVYRATHSKLGRTVAVKVLHGRRLSHPTAVTRFEREMKAVGQLEHPNIVRATDADEEDGVQYLVMEYLDGVDLSSIVRQRGPLQVPEACELVRQAAMGLEHARRNGFVHRDVKPANLMLWRGNDADSRISPVVKVLDLGLAVVDTPESKESLTSTGQAVGTIEYMAPEQIDETQQVDIRADIYSLGATLCRLLTGLTRFEAANQTGQRQKLRALATEDAPSVGSLSPDLPRKLVSIVDRMLATDPDQRYSTPQEVADVLQPFCEGADLNGLLETVSTVGDPSRSTPAGVNLRVGQADVSGKRPPSRGLAIILCAITVVLAVYAAIVIRIGSPEGTIVLKFDDPRLIGSVVTIDDKHVVTIESANHVNPLTIAADGNERALKIVRDGIPIFAQELIVKPDETQPIEVTWIPPDVDENAPLEAQAESMILEAGWRVKQVVEFEQPVDAAVFDSHDDSLYCVIRDGSGMAVEPDGARRTIMDQYTWHPTIAFDRRVLFFPDPNGGNLLQAVDLEDGTNICTINCSEGDNDLHAIAFAPPGFVPELLSSEQGLVLDVGFGGPMNVFRFNWQTSEAAPAVDNAELLRCPFGSDPDLAIGRDAVYFSNTTQLFRLEGRTLVQLPIELPAITDIAFDSIANDLLVQSGEVVKRVDPAGKRPMRDVLRGIKPNWHNRLRISTDGADVILCDVASSRVYVFTRDTP